MKANRVRWIAVALMAIGGIALTFTFRHNHSITTMIVTPRGAPIAGPALQFKHTVPAFGTVTNASRQVDACGLENVRLEVLRESTKDAAKRWMAALLESGDPRAKAVGLLMQAYTFGEDPVVVPVEGQNRTPLEQPRDELAELAVVTDDPAVYAMAIRVCRSKVDAFPRGPCRQLSLSAWAQSDAGNAVPWLLLAGEAQAHKDPAAEVSALDRAIESHTLNSYGTSLYAFAQSSMVKDVSPAQQYFLGTELLGYEAAWPESQYTAALKYCSAVAIQNAGVRQRCDALAELIASAATTIVDLSVAEGIGERLGWPSDKTSSMKEEIRGLAQALPADGGDSWSCDRVRIGNGYLAKRATLGELGAARDARGTVAQAAPGDSQTGRVLLRDLSHRLELARTLPDDSHPPYPNQDLSQLVGVDRSDVQRMLGVPSYCGHDESLPDSGLNCDATSPWRYAFGPEPPLPDSAGPGVIVVTAGGPWLLVLEFSSDKVSAARWQAQR